jgi:zinc protease
MVALPAPPVKLDDFYAYQLLDRLLGKGKLSRLHQRLVETDRLASMVTTEITETRDPFLLFIRANVRESSQIEAAERAVREELDKLTNYLPSPAELERAKKQCLTHFLNELEVTSDQAFAIGLFETLEQPDFLREYAERIQGLTAEEVRETAQRYLSPEHATVGIMNPGNREAY